MKNEVFRTVIRRGNTNCTYRIIEKSDWDGNVKWYEIQRRQWIGWSTLDDGDFPCESTYKWKTLEDAKEFFVTGTIRWPGTVILRTTKN